MQYVLWGRYLVGASKRRRARASLLWGAVFFAAVQVVLVMSLRAYPWIVGGEYGAKVQRVERKAKCGGSGGLIVMLGSSRVATGFRPDQLSEVGDGELDGDLIGFNFAQVGAGPEMAHLTLHRLLERGVRPHWVFVEYWAPFWGVRRHLGEYLRQIDVGCLALSDVGVLAGYVDRPSRLYSKWLLTQVSPIYASRAALLQLLAPWLLVEEKELDERCRNLDGNGWWAPEQAVDPAEYQRREATLRKIYAGRLDHYQVVREADQALQSIIELCQANEIGVGIVVLPESTVFRSWYSDEMLRGVDGYLKSMRDKYHIPVVDARAWVPDSAFMDGQHLLPRGATVFTRRFGEEIMAPLLAQDEVGRKKVRGSVRR